MAATDPPGDPVVVSDTCREQGCIGVRLPEIEACWGHVGASTLDKALGRLHETGRLDARGVQLGPDLVHRMLAALPPGPGGRRVLTSLDLRQANVAAGTSLSRLTVRGPARLSHAVFGGLTLDDVVFEGLVSFVWSVFEGRVALRHTQVGAPLHLSHAVLRGGLVLADVTVDGDALFDHVDVGDEMVMSGVWCTGDVSFVGTTFSVARRLGPLRAAGCVHLDGTVWRQRPLIDLSARRVSGRQSRFLAGVHLRVRHDPDADADARHGDGDGDGEDVGAAVEVALDDALLAHPSVVTDALPFPELGTGGSGPPSPRPDDAIRPRMISLARADVGGLTLSHLNVDVCRFAAAHNIDKLRLDRVHFATAPGWWRTRRQVVAEEVRWRVEHSLGGRNRAQWAGLAQWVDGYKPAVLHPAQIAGIYRDLRKGREDNRNEPGAADFYYGEMEMRRRAASGRQGLHGDRSALSALGEWVILTLYWLLAGYGLRAWRALASFTAVVTLGTVALHRWGFGGQPTTGSSGSAALPGDPSDWTTALLVSLRSATTLFSSADVPLTTTGHVVEIALRLSAPVLAGLAVLSIRGRVKR